MSALFMIISDIDEDAHKDFDQWYQHEHLPQAHQAFGSSKAQRGWTDAAPPLHVALYHFPSLEQAQQAIDEQLPTLGAEFDRQWGDKVRRVRHVLTMKQELLS